MINSYSRQNLLSSNSCKSNEDACSSSNNSPHSRGEQSYQTARNAPPTQMTHNILPVMGNKYLVQFRNQINQQNANISVVAPPDVLNINQHHQQQHQQLQQTQQLPPQHQQPVQSAHHLIFQQHQQSHQNDINPNSDLVMTNLNNFNISNVNSTQQSAGGGQSTSNSAGNSTSMNTASSNNFNVNGINLELNELKPRSTKMLPKGSTGGNKRIRQIREREQNNLTANNAGVDLNLASTVIRQDSK